MCQSPVQKIQGYSSVENILIKRSTVENKTTKTKLQTYKKPKTTVKQKFKKPNIDMKIEPNKAVTSMSKTEYFARIFGKTKNTKVVKDLIVPIVVNDKFSRNARLDIVGKKYYISKKDLQMVLISYIPQKLLDKIFDEKNLNRYGLDISILHNFGIDSRFSEEDVAVHISISADLRTPTDLKLSNNTKGMDEEFDYILNAKSATISGVSNFYISDSFTNSLTDNGFERQAMSLLNKTFVNYKDYIFNTGFVANEQRTLGTQEEKESLTRDFTYISKDFPKNNNRFSFGDISLTGLDNMGIKNIFGFSFIHHYNITKRMQNNIRVTEREIFLKYESQMEIRINDVLVRTMTLQPGTHLLSNFPLIAGLNNVKIKLTDIYGEVKEIDFNDFYYYELLRKGVYTYGISAGIGIDKNLNNGIKYEDNKKYLSGNFNIGLSKNITLETGLQISNNIYSYENKAFIGTDYGLFSAYGIVSKDKDLDYGYKYGFSYRNVIDKTSFSVSKDVIDDNYRSVISDPITDVNLSSNILNATISHALKNGTQLSASYSDRYSLGSSFKTTTLSYNQQVTKNWNIKFDLHRSKMTDTKPSYGAMFTLRYTPFKSKVSYLASVEQLKRDNESEVNTRASVNIQKDGRFGLDTTLEYENYEHTSEREALRFKYSDQAYTFNANYDQVQAYNGNINKSGNINFATAIAFVDDEYAITSPISNSFILIKNDDVLEDKPLGIKTFNEDEPSPTIVIPTTDYSTREILVDDKDLAFGIDLNQTEFKVASKYKEGSLVKISPKFILSAKGILHDKKDNPLAMKVFKVYDVAKDGTKTLIKEDPLFFTNTSGKFVIANMEEGDYFVEEINAKEPYSFKFTLKREKTSSALINIGVIKVAKDIKEEKKQKEPEKERHKLFMKSGVG